MLRIILICLSLFLFQGLQAQDDKELKTEDIIYLKGGNVFRGEIIEYKTGENVKLRSWNGTEFEFPLTDVLKIVQEPLYSNKKERSREYNFKERGIFNATNFSFLIGSNQWDEVITGPSLENVTGFQFNRLIGVGLGIGVDAYYPTEGEVFLPIFAQARGYVLEKRSSPMYKMDIGYGIPMKSENHTSAKGGIMLHPAAGFRFGAGSSANFTLDFGVKYQKASYVRSIWNGESESDVVYLRYTVSLGVLF